MGHNGPGQELTIGIPEREGLWMEGVQQVPEKLNEEKTPKTSRGVSW